MLACLIVYLPNEFEEINFVETSLEEELLLRRVVFE